MLFVVEGEVSVTVAGKTHRLDEGGYAYLPPKSGWRLRNEGATTARFHWIRKAYEYVDGLDVPEPLFLNEKDIAPSPCRTPAAHGQRHALLTRTTCATTCM